MGPASPSITSRTIHSVRNFALFSGAGVAIVCALVLLGWILDIGLLKSAIPGYPDMKANTAICLGLLAMGVVALSRGNARWQWILLLAGPAAAIATLTLVQYVTKTDFGLDQSLFTDAASTGRYPGRMSPLAALAIVSLAIALCLQIRDRQFHSMQQAAALLPFILGLLGTTGLIYRFQFLAGMGLGVAATMAVNTAVAIMLLALSILALNPDAGILRVVLANRSGGRFARRMLPAAILFPITMGWLQMLGQDAGYYDSQFGILIMVLSYVASMGGSKPTTTITGNSASCAKSPPG